MRKVLLLPVAPRMFQKFINVMGGIVGVETYDNRKSPQTPNEWSGDVCIRDRVGLDAAVNVPRRA